MTRTLRVALYIAQKLTLTGSYHERPKNSLHTVLVSLPVFLPCMLCATNAYGPSVLDRERILPSLYLRQDDCDGLWGCCGLRWRRYLVHMVDT